MHLSSPPAPVSTDPGAMLEIDFGWVEREVAQAPTVTSDMAAALSRLLWPNGEYHLVLVGDDQ